MTNKLWKQNWAESRQNYLDWWTGKGLVISMWVHLEKDGPRLLLAASQRRPLLARGRCLVV